MQGEELYTDMLKGFSWYILNQRLLTIIIIVFLFPPKFEDNKDTKILRHFYVCYGFFTREIQLTWKAQECKLCYIYMLDTSRSVFIRMSIIYN